MQYFVDDQTLKAEVFLAFVNQVWPGDYDLDKTQAALAKTLNITAYAAKHWWAACVSLQMAIISALLQNFWYCQPIRSKGSAAACCNWLKTIPPLGCILARSLGQRPSMRKMAAPEACLPI